MKKCVRCGLRKSCTQVVPSVGPQSSKIMLIGEGPGHEEDLRGEPFVGASGRLLDKMLLTAGLTRAEVVISNTVRCRPPDNRTPEPDEVKACRRWLWEEIKLIEPLILMPLGKTPAKLLLKGDSKFSITRAVGQPVKADYLPPRGIIVPLFHPSYLLRNNMEKVKDMVAVLRKAKNYVDQCVSRV